VQGDVLKNIDLQLHPPTSLTRKIASGLLGHLGRRSQHALAIRFHELKQLRMENGLNTELTPYYWQFFDPSALPHETMLYGSLKCAHLIFFAGVLRQKPL
jgi:hypothetical protein